MSAPGLADAEKAIRAALRHLDAARQSGDEAVQHDRYRQAAQRLKYASAVLAGLAPGQPAPAGVGVSLAMPGACPQAAGLPAGR